MKRLALAPNTLANQAMDQTRRAALASLATLVIADRYASNRTTQYRWASIEALEDGHDLR